MAVPPSTVNSVRCRPGAMVITCHRVLPHRTHRRLQISAHYTMTGVSASTIWTWVLLSSFQSLVCCAEDSLDLISDKRRRHVARLDAIVRVVP
jgi:hypothetical protein